jgi:RNA polymerase sigma-70 factor (ECF subfamily)
MSLEEFEVVALPALNGIPHPQVDSLIAGALAGDAAAFDALYQRDASRVYNLVLRSCGDPAEAEDICQEIWTRVHRSLGSLRDAGAFDTWVVRIAARVCIDAARRRHVEYDESKLMTLQDGSDVSSEIEEQEDRRLAWQALAALAPRQRLALYLREVDGLRYSDIAEALETTPAAVETLLFRARHALGQAYERLAEAPDERCRRARDLMALVLDGEGDVAEQRSLKAHLGGCRTCQREMTVLNRGRRGYAALPFIAAAGGIAPALLPGAGGLGTIGVLLGAGRVAALLGKATSVALPAVTAATVTVAAAVAASPPLPVPPAASPHVSVTVQTDSTSRFLIQPGPASLLQSDVLPQPGGSLPATVNASTTLPPGAATIPVPVDATSIPPAPASAPIPEPAPPAQSLPPQLPATPPVLPLALPQVPALPPVPPLPLPALPPIEVLPPVTLPQVSTPPITLPQVSTPPLSTPPVQVPSLAGLPSINVAPVTVPSVAVPQVTVPSVTLPQVSLPPVTLPAVNPPPAQSPQPPQASPLLPTAPLLPQLPVQAPRMPVQAPPLPLLR